MSEEQTIPELMSRLHSLHRQLKTLASRKTQGEHRIRVQKKKIADATARFDEIKGRHTEMVLKAREKEDRFNQSEEALKRRRTQLNEAKNNKEYQSLKDQISADQMINDKLAEEVLEMEEAASDFAPNVEAAKKEITDAETGLADAQKDLEENAPRIAEDVARINADLAVEEAKLPREFQGFYHRLVKDFGGDTALAPVVEHSFCGNCRQQIPIRYIAQICENKPYVCMACGRLLYLPEGFTIK